jgi:transcriptional regulator with XRE-family HTH domain
MPQTSRTGARLAASAVGHEIRLIRKRRAIKLTELAEAAQLSPGMLSLFENGKTLPSLSTLRALSVALRTPLVGLLRSLDEVHSATYVRAGEGLKIKQNCNSVWCENQLLGYCPKGRMNVAPRLVVFDSALDGFSRVQQSSCEFIYMLRGEMRYRHAGRAYCLRPGDSMMFDGSCMHGPEELTQLPVYFLSIQVSLRPD